MFIYRVSIFAIIVSLLASHCSCASHAALLAQTAQEQLATLSSLSADTKDLIKKDLIASQKKVLEPLLTFYQQLNGHTKGITSVAFSSDGSCIITGSIDKTARIWDTRSGKCQHELKGVTSTITSVALSPHSRVALTGLDNCTACLWSIKTGICKKILQHTLGVTAVALSPHGKHALTGSCDKSVCLWNVRTGKIIDKLDHSDIVSAVTFNSHGTHVLIGLWNGTAYLWNVTTRKHKKLEAHISVVKAVAFSPDTTYGLTAYENNYVYIWDLKTGKTVTEFRGSFYAVDTAAFSPDGIYAFIGLSNNALCLLHLPTRTTQTLTDQTAGTINAAAFSPDGKLFLTGSHNGSARIWNRPRPHELNLEQLLFIIKLAQSPINLDDRTACTMLQSLAPTIDIFSFLPSAQYHTNPLIKAYIDLRRRQLLNAAKHDDVNAVSLLLKKGFSLNTCDKTGNTLWHYAFIGHIESGEHKPSEKVLELLLVLAQNIQGLKNHNKAGLPAFALGIIYHTQFTRDFLKRCTIPATSDYNNATAL